MLLRALGPKEGRSVQCLRKPYGHGFIAAASINEAGKVKDIAARLMVTF
jgi:hypothetical protein